MYFDSFFSLGGQRQGEFERSETVHLLGVGPTAYRQYNPARLEVQEVMS